MKRNIIKLLLIPFLSLVFLSPLSAANLNDAFKVDDGHVCLPSENDRLDCTANAGGYNVASEEKAVTPEIIARTLVNVILSVLGIIFLIMTILSGVRWMLAGGNQEKVDKNKRSLTESVIGLAIILGAYAISYFVLFYVFK
jgi:hypothetical protein